MSKCTVVVPTEETFFECAANGSPGELLFHPSSFMNPESDTFKQAFKAARQTGNKSNVAFFIKRAGNTISNKDIGSFFFDAFIYGHSALIEYFFEHHMDALEISFEADALSEAAGKANLVNVIQDLEKQRMCRYEYVLSGAREGFAADAYWYAAQRDFEAGADGLFDVAKNGQYKLLGKLLSNDEIVKRFEKQCRQAYENACEVEGLVEADVDEKPPFGGFALLLSHVLSPAPIGVAPNGKPNANRKNAQFGPHDGPAVKILIEKVRNPGRFIPRAAEMNNVYVATKIAAYVMKNGTGIKNDREGKDAEYFPCYIRTAICAAIRKKNFKTVAARLIEQTRFRDLNYLVEVAWEQRDTETIKSLFGMGATNAYFVRERAMEDYNRVVPIANQAMLDYDTRNPFRFMATEDRRAMCAYSCVQKSLGKDKAKRLEMRRLWDVFRAHAKKITFKCKLNYFREIEALRPGGARFESLKKRNVLAGMSASYNPANVIEPPTKRSRHCDGDGDDADVDEHELWGDDDA